jgi:hypothetical protein
MKRILKEICLLVVLLAATVALTGVFAEKALATCNGVPWIQDGFCRTGFGPCGWTVNGFGCRTDDSCQDCTSDHRYNNCYYEDGTCLCFPFGKINFAQCGLGTCLCGGGYLPPGNDY